MIQWDSNGIKGMKGRYEVTLIPFGEGWSSVLWINKTHIVTLNPVESKSLAQNTIEMYVDELEKTTRRLLDRIGYQEEAEET